MFTVTKHHQDIFDWVAAPTSKAAIIEAVAGSGKTGTLQQVMRRIPESDEVLYLAFNKKAVEEMVSRGVPVHCKPMTLNSLGHRCLLRALGAGIALDARKTNTLMDNLFGRDSFEARAFGGVVRTLVAKAKTHGLVPASVKSAKGLTADTQGEWAHLVDRYGIDPPMDDDGAMPKAIDMAREVLEAGIRNVSVIDFDDQLFLPVVLGLGTPKFDWVLIDEAQDVSKLQLELVTRCIAPDGNLVAVGDRHQAIYGFRGASHTSLDDIASRFSDTKLLPLSVSYRCPRLVVDQVKQYVPHMQSTPMAIEGEVTHITTEEFERFDFLPTDLVVCRNNAPLVSLAYKLWRRKIPCVVLGRDIGKGVQALLKKMKARSVPDLLAAIPKHLAKQRTRLLAANKETQLAKLEEEAEILMVFAVEAKSIDQLSADIDAMFADEGAGRCTLCSIHKAKGSEAERVVFLDPWRLPSGRSKSLGDLQQERNLFYVAATRAKKHLFYASLDPSKSTVVRYF